MSKFPPLLLLLASAVGAQADSVVSAFPIASVKLALGVAMPDLFSFAAPEPGVMVALISGAAILLARRRRV